MSIKLSFWRRLLKPQETCLARLITRLPAWVTPRSKGNEEDRPVKICELKEERQSQPTAQQAPGWQSLGTRRQSRLEPQFGTGPPNKIRFIPFGILVKKKTNKFFFSLCYLKAPSRYLSIPASSSLKQFVSGATDTKVPGLCHMGEFLQAIWRQRKS